MTRFIPVLLAVFLIIGTVACGRSDRRSGTPVPGESRSRIVSLAPNITETLYALGLGDRVAGVTRFCNYPAEAREKPRVGGFLDINYEALVSLYPDLVILLPEHADVRKRVENLGIPVLTVHNRVVGEILDTIAVIGSACGVKARSDSLVRDIGSRIDTVRKRAEGRTRPRVLLVVERKVGGVPESVFVAGTGTFYDELITLAGGVNAYDGPGIAYPEISTEGILRLDPDIIVDIIPTIDAQGITPEAARSDWTGFGAVRAVKTGRVHVIGESYAVIPGPRFIRMLEELARIIHPERTSG